LIAGNGESGSAKAVIKFLILAAAYLCGTKHVSNELRHAAYCDYMRNSYACLSQIVAYGTVKTYSESLFYRLVAAFLAGTVLSLFSGFGLAQSIKNDLSIQNSSPPISEPRVALIIGNGAYRHAAPLKNPPNDARAMSDALTELGFTVLYRQDASHKEMTILIRQFGDRLRNGGVGLFYYAGHGMQVRGRNYLIPIDAEIEREDEIAYNSIDANLVLEKMESANNRLNILILDACRNNPFARSFRSSSQGLAQMDAPVGALVAFATSPGSVASDGEGENGLYTRYLLENIRQPGMRVEDVFKNVRAAVRRESGGKQIPWEATSLEGDFYFRIAKAAPATPVNNNSRNNEAFELAFWDSIKASTNAEDYKAYLAEFPDGRFSGLARNRIAASQIKTPQVSSEKQTPAAESSSPPPPIALQGKTDGASPKMPPRTSNTAVEERSDFVPKIGDRWEYAVIDGFKKSKAREEILEIEKIDAEGIQYTNHVYRTDHTGINVRNGMDGTAYSPSNELLRFPLEPGKQWSGRFTARTKEDRAVVHEYKTTVIRKEKVVVPAGTFNTFYIEQTAYFKGQDPASASYSGATGAGYWSSTKRIWFAPEIRNFVKSETKVRNSGGKNEEWEERELIRYQVN
jgi:hypothetical protein